MKTYRFYFYATLLFLSLDLLILLVACLSFGKPVSISRLYGSRSVVDYLPLLALIAHSVSILSIIRMLRQYRERTWVTAMFIPLCLSLWMSSINSLLAAVSYFRAGSEYGLLTPILRVAIIIGYIGFAIGCFSIREPVLRKSYRQMIWFLIGASLGIAIFLNVPLSGYRTYLIKSGLQQLVQIILYLPLLFLNWKLWRKDPSEETWEQAVDGIGKPEEA